MSANKYQPPTNTPLLEDARKQIESAPPLSDEISPVELEEMFEAS